MFPTATRPIKCPNQSRRCVCDDCLPVHCPDCDKNFADIAAYEQHIRLPCTKRWCAYCFAPFFRRLELIEHYESGACNPDRSTHQAISKPSETTPLLPTAVDTRVVRPPDLATQQSWNEDTQRYKCYLCNPVRLGFYTLAAINEHLASPQHKAKSYKCPHTACNLPFNTIGGLVQHIETRSCRCITDSKWWNTYLALPRGGNRPWGMADGTSVEAGRSVEEMEEDSATLASLDSEDELALENFWVGRYFAMTGPDGSWVSEGDGYLLRAGFALLVFGDWVRAFISWIGGVLQLVPKSVFGSLAGLLRVFRGWVCALISWIGGVLQLVPKSVFGFLVGVLPVFAFGVIFYYYFGDMYRLDTPE